MLFFLDLDAKALPGLQVRAEASVGIGPGTSFTRILSTGGALAPKVVARAAAPFKMRQHNVLDQPSNAE